MRIAYFCRIRKIGNSKVLIIPREIRTIIEANQGDLIRVEVEKVNENDNLHDDNATRQDPEACNKGIHKEE